MGEAEDPVAEVVACGVKMTLTSIGKHLGTVAAALQVAAHRIIGRSSDRDPVISLALLGDDTWEVRNYGRSLAYNVQIEPITFSGLTATFLEIPVLSYRAKPVPRVTSTDKARGISRGPLSPHKRDVREILLSQWDSEGRISADIPVDEQAYLVKLKYRNEDGWNFTVTADLVLRVISRELSIRNIGTGEREECSPVSI